MSTIDPLILQRNEKYIRTRLERQLTDSLNKGNKFLDKELSNPFLFGVKPIVKAFYNSFARNEISKGSTVNLEITMKAAISSVKDENADLDQLVEENFPKYFENDQTARYCKKTHRNFPWLKQNTKKTFKNQLIPLIELLKCTKDAENYDELVVKAFQTPENSKERLSLQLDTMAAGIRKLKEDDTILDIPVARNLILRVLIQGFKETRKELIGDIDYLFTKYVPN